MVTSANLNTREYQKSNVFFLHKRKMKRAW